MKVYNYKLTLEYDGSSYHGTQVQKQTKNTVFEKTLQALKKTLDNDLLELNFCGRTDAGVHAFAQVINVKTHKEFKKNKLALGINYNLRGEAITFTSSIIVRDDFHARHSAIQRIYVYKILNRGIKSPIHQSRVWFLPYKLDLDVIKKATELFAGTHDFSLFRNIECSAKSPLRTIDFFKVEFLEDGFIEFKIAARSFLYNMVRIIVGSVIDCARGKITFAQLEKKLRQQMPCQTQVAPSKGLYFLEAKFLD